MSSIPTPDESFAVQQALYKRLAANVSTKDPANIRGLMDYRARVDWERDGIKSRDLKLAGVKVGSITAKTRKVPVIEDLEAVEGWMRDNGHMGVTTVITCTARGVSDEEACGLAEEARARGFDVEIRYAADDVDVESVARECKGRWVSTDTGEVIPGVTTGEVFAGTMVRDCKPDDVCEVLRGLPDSGMVIGLLEGSNG